MDSSSTATINLLFEEDDEQFFKEFAIENDGMVYLSELDLPSQNVRFRHETTSRVVSKQSVRDCGVDIFESVFNVFFYL